MVKNKLLDNISIDGGILCLDFANTVHDRKNEPLKDYFTSFNDLLYWAKKLRIIDTNTFRLLEKTATEKRQKANSFFSESIMLRELVHRIFKAISEGKKCASEDLDEFNSFLSSYFSFLHLTQRANGFNEDWSLVPDDFYRITAPIINSAYELLLSDKLARVKECPNCGWLFLDTTKNGKRRWCSMKNCGSNIKALEWYRRQKKN